MAAATALVVLVVLVAVCFFGGGTIFVYLRRRKGHGGGGSGDVEQQTSSSASAKVTDAPSSTTTTSTTAPKNKQEGEEEEAGSMVAIRVFSWPEIESLTGNFDPNWVIGEGGFSTVYLARYHLQRAIKVHRFSQRLHRAFRQELDALLRLCHPNIVTLLGYCDDHNHEEDGALVLEYVPGGTLHDRLHHHGTGTGTSNSTSDDDDDLLLLLSWPRRMSIAYQLALAVRYLHDDCDPQVVHGDIKSANVLLDARADPKLCDFGSARMGFSAAVRADKPTMTGSPGYVDPHYLRSGMVSKKSDVYSFGVLLLELVTGEEAFCVETERPLTAVVGPMLRSGTGTGEVAVDGRLGGEYDAAQAAAALELCGRCVGDQPSLRPSMAEAVRVLRALLGPAGGSGR